MSFYAELALDPFIFFFAHCKMMSNVNSARKHACCSLSYHCEFILQQMNGKSRQNMSQFVKGSAKRLAERSERTAILVGLLKKKVIDLSPAKASIQEG